MKREFAKLRRALVPFGGLRVPWWVAGGWALDLFLGRQTRAHHGVDVAILRRDQAAVRCHFAGWSLRWIEPRWGGESYQWQADEWLTFPVHEIHGMHPHGGTIELLLNESVGETWNFRHDERIRRLLGSLAGATPQGIPYLAPEVVLLYKSVEFRGSDAADFANARDALDAEQRAWLAHAIGLAYGEHPWRSML